MPLLERWKFLSARQAFNWRRLFGWLGASLPNRCLMCHQTLRSGGSGICETCLGASLYHRPSCLGCGRPLVMQTRYCGSCMVKPPLAVVAPGSYHQGIGEHVAAIKYQGQLAALDCLCDALVARIEALEALGLTQWPQAIVAVPLHPNRLRQRGFNQAWLIAKVLSDKLKLPLLEHAVIRSVDTRPQEGLTGRQRRRNLADAFKLQQDIEYQRIAIVDDVVTTGTTVNTIAKLFEARYIQVQVWCLARAEAPGLSD
ncbi:double zinc ribbon domain-containing protein [Shewanella sp. AS1]|uniref:ComF family protein n=1 Tax=Shewanella sp. AS1 TaxID=2907626 RepID=UPI001F1C6D07|nr:double zinc ribbon domain-containing protein [Shewanella sp. AS1]MCE9680150.1 double zinc ribbon domain-containing protein [Shewanella sp. AS1]